MKSFNKTAPILFLLVSVIFSALLIFTLLCGRYFIPVSAPVFSAVVAAIGLALTYMASEGSEQRFAGKNFISALLPLCAVFFGIFYTYNTKTGTVFSIATSSVYLLCALVIFYRCCDNKKFKITLGIIYTVFFAIPFIAVMFVLGAISKQNEIYQSTALTSPNGSYTAVAQNTRVEVTPNNNTVNIGIGKLQPFAHTVYESSITVTSADITWLDDTTLLIGENEYNMKYIAEANLFYNFSETAEKLSAYVPARYCDNVVVKSVETTVYTYNLNDEEVAEIKSDIENNANWLNMDENEVSERLGDVGVDLSDCDCYCATPEECDRYLIVALYNEKESRLTVVKMDLS